MTGCPMEAVMTVTIQLTFDEYSWLREAVDQMLDDIPHMYGKDDSERMMRIGRAIHAHLERAEQEQVYTH